MKPIPRAHKRAEQHSVNVYLTFYLSHTYPLPGIMGCTNIMTTEDITDSVREKIEEFPEPHRSDMLQLWEEWLKTNPQHLLYISWSAFSAKNDNQNDLFTERRVFLKRIKNELRNHEVPLTLWQKVAKGLAAAASLFLIVFLAISRVFRVTD